MNKDTSEEVRALHIGDGRELVHGVVELFCDEKCQILQLAIARYEGLEYNNSSASNRVKSSLLLLYYEDNLN